MNSRWTKWSWKDLQSWDVHCKRCGIRAMSVHLNADATITLEACDDKEWLAHGMDAPAVRVTVAPDEQENYLMGYVLDACAREAAALIGSLQVIPRWERERTAVSAGQCCPETPKDGQVELNLAGSTT